MFSRIQSTIQPLAYCRLNLLNAENEVFSHLMYTIHYNARLHCVHSLLRTINYNTSLLPAIYFYLPFSHLSREDAIAMTMLNGYSKGINYSLFSRLLSKFIHSEAYRILNVNHYSKITANSIL